MGVLRGRTAVVTGGGNGVSAAIARRFADEGATVALLDTASESADRVARDIVQRGGDAFVEVCDVSQSDQVRVAIEVVVERCGHIDALVTNASTLDRTDFLEIKAADWQRVLAVGLTGSFLVTQAVARNMAAHGGGAIVCVASICAHMAEAGYTSYSSVNGGMLLLVKSAAVELGKLGIRVNSVSPGYIDTPEEDISSPELLDYLRNHFSRVPLRRLVRPEEIAAACFFLCSDDASAITGTDLVVDAGTLADSWVPESFPAHLRQA